MRRIAAIFVALVVLGAVAWLVRTLVAGPAGPAWITGRVERGDLTVTVDATGTVEPVSTVEISAQVSGRIAEVRADYNDRVEAGQLLAVIDREPILVRLQEARANLAAATAQLQQATAARAEANSTLGRTEQLVRRGVLSAQQLDVARSTASQATAAVATARAEIALARSAIDAIETELEHTEIRSPVDGVVLSRSAEPGQVVAVTFQPPTLLVIAEDLSRMQVLLLVDEADVGQVEPGQPARFTVDAFPGRTFDARVESVRKAPRTVQGVVSYEAVLSVDNADGSLMPGMTASAQIVTEEVRDALLVPNAALRFVPPGREAQRSGATVWRLSGDEPVPITIEPGATNGQQTVVRSGGVAAGDVVLVDVEETG